MKQAIFAGLAAGLLVGCGGAPQAPEPARVAHEATVRPDCYTVDLFSPAVVVKPTAEVPEDWRGYVGRWGGAAWDGEWCHDLHVLEVTPEGRVSVVETHAPYPEWGKPVTAFRRTARIGEDGRLRLKYGGTTVQYWIEEGKLYGLREEGDIERRIALTYESAV